MRKNTMDLRALPFLLIASAILLTACQTLGLKGGLGQAFPSPEAAGEPLVAALKNDDNETAVKILGPGSEALLTSGDPVMDKNQQDRFVGLYEQQNAWIAWSEGVAVLEIGEDNWPFPIPLVRQGNGWLDNKTGWRFDTPEGIQEILNRRIGKNELSTIQACLAFVDAEREYYRINPQNRSTPEYARFILSSEGSKDGLYWPTSEGEALSPLGPLYAAARSQGYSPTQGGGKPFGGYFYRILPAQGPSAPGGALDYIEKGAMTGGFALLAFPAGYGTSGVMSFLVNQIGLVYEKDLGPETAKTVSAIETFNPDESWDLVPAQALVLPAD
ncbi:MAG TPA: DUF2950 domain-containing protein [Myxococcales bacterium]|nr:DUF2950 domain-containing protein [Myxococcales bacterium]